MKKVMNMVETEKRLVRPPSKPWGAPRGCVQGGNGGGEGRKGLTACEAVRKGMFAELPRLPQ